MIIINNMKVISPYKDYYDFLSGVWGEDPKLILDRRKHSQPDISLFKDNDYGTLYICGDKYDFAYKNGEFIYLSELEKHYEVFSTTWNWNKDVYKKVGIMDEKFLRHITYLYTEIIPDDKELNKEKDCPIILILNGNPTLYSFLFPKLADLQFNKVMKPEEIYIKLSNWVSPKDDIVDKRTNLEKIITNGFDKINSFRNTK